MSRPAGLLLLLLPLFVCCRSTAADEKDATALPDSPGLSDLSPPDSAAGTITFTGAGDIAWCVPPGVGSGEVTAKLLDQIPGPLFTTGDNSNGDGTLAEYQTCFGPSWGRHKARIRPAPGNHDYTAAIPDGADYHAYFGAAAGPKGKGYYSYDLGTWHIVVLNSECGLVSCNAGDAQEAWLKADLAAHPSTCTVAIWHRPHFSYNSPTGSSYTRDLFADIYSAGVDLLLTGHYHWYERFKPMDPQGAVDTARGVRQIIVGTGGSLPMINNGGWIANSETHIEDVFGVLKLTLRPDRYDWEFVPEAGKTATDSGGDLCH